MHFAADDNPPELDGYRWKEEWKEGKEKKRKATEVVTRAKDNAGGTCTPEHRMRVAIGSGSTLL